MFVHESHGVEDFIHDWSLPPETPILPIAVITVEAIVEASKSATRKMSIFLDLWYMACIRTSMITRWYFSQVNVSKVPDMSSPASMQLTTTGVHTYINQRIVPLKTVRLVRIKDFRAQRNLQLLQSLSWETLQPNREYHSPLSRSAISKWMRMKSVQNTH